MITIIFEVIPKPGHKDAYLEVAASMREAVETIDGFIEVERFQSLTNPDKLLSLSTFRDEAAVEEWRNLAVHRRAQSKGRNIYFENYRLRVVSVLRDYGKHDRAQAPADSRSVHENEDAS